MQRKPTKNTRGPNAEEKRFQGWLKMQDCVWCGNTGPSIVDHARGSTFKHNKVLVGHWFCLPACTLCDHKKTIGGKRQGNEAEAWLVMQEAYSAETARSAPLDVLLAIEDWDK